MLRRAAWVFGLLCAANGAAAQAGAGPERAPSVVLFPTHASGVDPAVAPFVDRALRDAASARGYAPLQGERSAEQGASTSAQPPSIAELSRVTAELGASHGVLAVVWASRGRYAVQLRAVRPAAPAPQVVQAEVGHRELEPVVARLLAQVLPEVSSAGAPEPLPGGAQAPVPVAAEAAPEAAAMPEPPRFRLALHNDLAFGVADDPFLNDVLGVRADLRAGRALWFGAHCGYANLPGRTGRVSAVLCYGQAEQRIALGQSQSFVPLRVAIGYLTRNGGFLRVSSGLALPLGEHTEVVFDLPAPTFWATPDKTLFALAVGLELATEL